MINGLLLSDGLSVQTEKYILRYVSCAVWIWMGVNGILLKIAYVKN